MNEKASKTRKRIVGYIPKWTIALLLAAAAVGGAIVIFSQLPDRTPTTEVKLSAHAISSENADRVTLLACLGKGELNDIAYSPDGVLFAVASSRGVFIYDTRSYEEINFFESDIKVEGISFSPDGTHLALTTDGSVQLLRVSGGSPVCSTSGICHALRSRWLMSEIIFSPDGSYMASTDDHGVYIWALPSAELVSELFTMLFPSITFTPDSAYLAQADQEFLNFWRLSDGELERAIPLPTDWRVLDIDFSPDGLYWATASIPEDYDKPGSVVQVWQVPDDEPMRIQELDVKVNSITFSPDSLHFALGTREGVRLCQVSDGSPLATLGDGYMLDPTFSPDGTHLACRSGTDVQIWRVSDGLKMHTLEGFTAPVESITFFPEDGYLASTGKEINLWRLSDRTLVKRLEIGENKSITFSPKGDFLACACYDDIVQLRRFPEGTLMSVLEIPTDWTISISPDGNHFSTTSCKDKTVHLWRTADGGLEHIFEGHEVCPGRVAFSPDGVYLAWGPRIWDVSKGTLVRALGEHEGGELIFSPDGAYLASPTRIWKSPGGPLLHKLEGVASCESINISPDGAFLASTSGHVVHLWRAADGMLIHTLEGPCGPIHTDVYTAFSPDSTLLAAAFSDYHCTIHSVLLWRVTDGALLCTLEEHTDRINDVAFSPDGANLASCSSDGTVRLWGLHP